MSNYARGYAFERRVKLLLESMGYFVVRSSGSHGIADLVALRVDARLLIQCKRSGAISIAEWNELYDTCARIGAEPILAQMRGARGTVLYVLTGRRAQGCKPMELWTLD